MRESIEKLEGLLKLGMETIPRINKFDLLEKTNPDKWSKKEILGHLIDSGINNLQRFTEIQFEDKPYKIKSYRQDELVKANNYHASPVNELMDLWIALNQRIVPVMKEQNNESLDYVIEFYNGEVSDLRFLMTDYVSHLEHHIDQLSK